MTIKEYFKIWKKEQGINYVEGQEDLFKFADDFAKYQNKEFRGLLISALSIAKREGKTTHWDGFIMQIEEALNKEL